MIQTSDTLLETIEGEMDALPLDAREPHLLYEPIRYILEDGGKRIRPILCLLGCNVYCDEPLRAMAPAVAVEVFHNFTLLHDDIMDKAELRRGRPAAYLKWGDSAAILSGDAMLILAYQLLCESPADRLPEMLQVFNRAAMEVCQGQQYDMDFESRDDVRMEEYIEMIRLKTSVLLAAALELGAIAGGASPEQRRAIYEFGVNLGLAFQIQDDLLDTYGDSETFGKMIGGDIAVGKKTFLHITAMQRATPVQQAEILREGDIGEKLPRVRALYNELKVQEETEKAIDDYFDKALAALRQVHPLAERRSELEKYARSLMKRTR